MLLSLHAQNKINIEGINRFVFGSVVPLKYFDCLSVDTLCSAFSASGFALYIILP